MDLEVSIRLAETDQEYAACETLSRDIWGVADRNIVPRELLKTMQLNGGVVIGAFLPDGRLAGFVFGFAGVREGRLRLCSHQLGVIPEFRGRGIGVALKQAQGEHARRLGYELVTWTFDPLEARNAYINLHRLGAIARLYDRDHYGKMEDELNRGLPSDRFEVEWWVGGAAPGLRERRGTSASILRVGRRGEPELEVIDPTAGWARLEVPTDFQTVKRRDMALARRWRQASRQAFEAALAAGLWATDFEPSGAYIMVRQP